MVCVGALLILWDWSLGTVFWTGGIILRSSSSTTRVEIHYLSIMTRRQMILLSTLCPWLHSCLISQQISFHAGLIVHVFYPGGCFGRDFDGIMLQTVPQVRAI